MFCSHSVCVVYKLRKKTAPHTTPTDLFFIIYVESVYCAVFTESLYKTETFCLQRVKIRLSHKQQYFKVLLVWNCNIAMFMHSRLTSYLHCCYIYTYIGLKRLCKNIFWSGGCGVLCFLISNFESISPMNVYFTLVYLAYIK